MMSSIFKNAMEVLFFTNLKNLNCFKREVSVIIPTLPGRKPRYRRKRY